MLVKLGQACTRMILEELHLMLQLKKENQNNLKNCIFAIAICLRKEILKAFVSIAVASSIGR
jgi:hypothetical protein